MRRCADPQSPSKELANAFGTGSPKEPVFEDELVDEKILDRLLPWWKRQNFELFGKYAFGSALVHTSLASYWAVEEWTEDGLLIFACLLSVLCIPTGLIGGLLARQLSGVFMMRDFRRYMEKKRRSLISLPFVVVPLAAYLTTATMIEFLLIGSFLKSGQYLDIAGEGRWFALLTCTYSSLLVVLGCCSLVGAHDSLELATCFSRS
eukprot:TRINITY_DN2817_c0_g1_i2.p1 TRINITY_DN2817_c0_g1~~TRINITY_DN2817_c0_g1_i2.p1  ORF type:complete len:206 (+),score=9.78 TRINITY_DN2817_c0_g1_i2:73-690(+)